MAPLEAYKTQANVCIFDLTSKKWLLNLSSEFAKSLFVNQEGNGNWCFH